MWKHLFLNHKLQNQINKNHIIAAKSIKTIHYEFENTKFSITDDRGRQLYISETLVAEWQDSGWLTKGGLYSPTSMNFQRYSEQHVTTIILQFFSEIHARNSSCISTKFAMKFSDRKWQPHSPLPSEFLKKNHPFWRIQASLTGYWLKRMWRREYWHQLNIGSRISHLSTPLPR